ncbi:ion transporter, partial [uncultured Nitratireductor sp.]|uniref:ion transporter n=1 Tax=uncultured Nitratireductor sp. TaxID=520953 RepID=UPI003457D780
AAHPRPRSGRAGFLTPLSVQPQPRFDPASSGRLLDARRRAPHLSCQRSSGSGPLAAKIEGEMNNGEATVPQAPGASTTAAPSRLQRLIEAAAFQHAITALILVNACILGLETVPSVMAATGEVLMVLDRIIVGIFAAEILAKLWVYRRRFFADSWNLFDFTVVAISLVPASAAFSVLRALRVLRVLRLVSVVPSMRKVVQALLGAIPGMGSIVALLGLIYYVCSVIATKLFGAAFPEWFGSIGASAYSLFQIMTLESWSMGIVRPVMEVYPLAWLFFIPFIVSTTFTVLNLFIGIIVSAMQAEHDEEASAERTALQAEQEMILTEIRSLRKEVQAMNAEKQHAER